MLISMRASRCVIAAAVGALAIAKAPKNVESPGTGWTHILQSEGAEIDFRRIDLEPLQ